MRLPSAIRQTTIQSPPTLLVLVYIYESISKTILDIPHEQK
jgi:hypothetical protein